MAKKTINETPTDLSPAQLMFSYIGKVLDQCEKEDQISSVVDDGYVMPTGLLVLDWIMNGGVRSGWITSIGMEQSCKTSIAIKMLGSLVKRNIPGYFIDAENALNTDNACAIAGIDKPEEYFGRRSANGKGWDIIPKIRYTSENSIEKDFTFMQRILLKLPDKLCRDKQWYYVCNDNEDDKISLLESMGLKKDTKLATQTGRCWYPAEDGRFQMVFIIDSVKAMIPEDEATDADEASAAMALQARAFSKYGPKVRGILRRKHAVVLSINQQRLNPGARFTAPEYEPCGEYLKYATDTRNEMASTSVPDTLFNTGVLPDTKTATKMFGQEPSVLVPGEIDTYFYKKIKNSKMKGGTPWKRGMCRTWGQGETFKGFDPVFDVYEYLELTEQALLKSVNKRKEIYGLTKFIPQLQGTAVAWQDFKKLILAFTEGREDLKQEFIDSYGLQISTEELPDIKAICHQQVETREAFSPDIKNPELAGLKARKTSSKKMVVLDDEDDFDESEDQNEATPAVSEDDFEG